jgi:solute carrier family 13 (sodium-dependent dicarboxylate transporter), member 2/3/5
LPKFSKLQLKYAALLGGIVVALILFFVNPFHVGGEAPLILAIAGLMITWWITEALPMPVVALIPLVVFPLFKIATLEETAAPYANPVIFLFMGGFLLGLAIEKWNLHRRIALNIVRLTGTSGNRIVLGFILATGLLSMWLSNTATTMMMFPIALSVIHVMKENHKGEGDILNFSLAIMLAIAYASNIGGIATIIGTPPNVAYVAHINKKYHYNIDFVDWMLICTPLSLILLGALYLVMVKWLFPSRITRDIINNLQHLFKLDDTIIAIMCGIALFICPSGKKEEENDALLEWNDTSKMAWGILLLFGGGISLASTLEKAGLMEQLGGWLSQFSSNGFLLIVIITVVSIFISEIMSNVAQVIVFAPVISSLADALHMDPILLGLPMTLAASCAGMLPMGTPPNAIVFASGYIKFRQMAKTGFIMNIVSIILIVLFCWFILPFLIKM